MTALPKGICQTCGKLVAIRNNGCAREHRGGSGAMCRGSGERLAPLEQLEMFPAVAVDVSGTR
jgi:hypothetical protein